MKTMNGCVVRSLCARLAVLLAAVPLAASLGCQKPDSSSAGGAPAANGAANKGSDDKAKGDSSQASGKSAEAVPAPGGDGMDVLKEMVAAYKKAQGYFDMAKIRAVGREKGQPVDEAWDYHVVFTRPNKLRLEVFNVSAVCDGKQFFAFAKDLEGQAILRPAPERFALKELFGDDLLMQAMTQGPTMQVSWVPLPLLMMLVDDPLKTLLYQSKQTERMSPASAGDFECDRVKITRRDGTAVLWIDRRSRILRRFELPIDAINKEAKLQDSELESIVINFDKAQFDQADGPETFRFEMQKDAQARDYLLMPPYALVGKTAPDFSFTDLDGKKVDRKSLEGKIVVLECWSTTCEPCRRSMPMLEKVYQRYKTNDKIAFLAVNVDEPGVADKDVKAALAEMGSTLPIVRDPSKDAGLKLKLFGIPSSYLLGPNGTVQYFQEGFPMDLDQALAKQLEALLAGKDLTAECLKSQDERHKAYASQVDKMTAGGLFVQRSLDPEIEVAAATKPRSLVMNRLWKSADATKPGNLLVVPQSSGAPPLFVIEGAKSVLEIGLDGKTLATHPLDIAKEEAVTFLRTATDRSGKRYFAAAGLMGQRVHLFDEKWKLLSHFPADAVQEGQQHAGIADAQLADFNGDGAVELAVGYLGNVGLHLASMEGKRLEANRALSNVARVVALGPGPQGKYSILCTSEGMLVQLDDKLNQIGDVKLPRPVTWIAVDDLDADQKPDVCCLCLDDQMADPFRQAVVGVNLKGEELWSHTLPKGMFERQVEPILVGRLSSNGPAVWIVPAPDGSLRFIDLAGKILDEFNYGASLAGMASVNIDGKPALIVATKDSLEAWSVEQK
jgi:thiol-disulfide isomerase/thioredoxin/outer membrane lipoprotein-sorting protein